MPEPTLKLQLQQQMKEAMKARHADRLAVLRMILNEIGSTQALDPEADELACVKGYHKRLTKSLADYEKAGDAERLAKLKSEIEIVAEFLPARLSDAEIEAVVEQAVADGGFTQRDFGRAMKEIMSRLGGQADGARVSASLKTKLGG